MGAQAVKSRDLPVFVSANPHGSLNVIYFKEAKAKRVAIFNLGKQQENGSGEETSVPNY